MAKTVLGQNMSGVSFTDRDWLELGPGYAITPIYVCKRDADYDVPMRTATTKTWRCANIFQQHPSFRPSPHNEPISHAPTLPVWLGQPLQQQQNSGHQSLQANHKSGLMWHPWRIPTHLYRGAQAERTEPEALRRATRFHPSESCPREPTSGALGK